MIQGIDGVRGLAVLLVMLFHNQLFRAGWIGVTIFFVLSGFLITGILLQDRGVPLGAFVKSFYGRRFLRIFPVYYAYLALLFGTLQSGIVTNAVVDYQLKFALTYTYDFFHASRGFTLTYFLSHSWSLAVEEQFYLVWPFFIYFCPPKQLVRWLWTIILAGPLVRASISMLCQHWGLGTDDPIRDIYVLPTSHVDAFAVGALLRVRQLKFRPSHLAFACLALGLAEGVYRVRFHSSLFDLTLPNAYGYLWGYTALNLTSAVLIGLVADGAFLNWFFRMPVLSYFGRISYGVYIFHFPIVLVAEKLARNVWPTGKAMHLLAFALDLALTLVVAAISFHFFEAPILAQKDRWFPRRRAALAATTATATTATPAPATPCNP